ncbi:MAG: carbon storage regulator [Thermoguttaceae bacterium]|nr:carbon storage regulator [Thermoguttaceae bacterium]
MLVLSRRKDESVIINGNIRIVVVDARGDKVRLGIEAPDNVNVYRSELYEKIRGGKVASEPRAGLDKSDLEAAESLLTPTRSSERKKGGRAASVADSRSLSLTRDGVGYREPKEASRDADERKESDSSSDPVASSFPKKRGSTRRRSRA